MKDLGLHPFNMPQYRAINLGILEIATIVYRGGVIWGIMENRMDTTI